MNERGCYCELWDTKPAALESQGVPRGYCGFCQVCGAPGHTRHFPGGVGYTGCWCDRHYRRLSWLHPLAWPGMFVYLLLVALGVLLVRVLFGW